MTPQRAEPGGEPVADRLLAALRAWRYLDQRRFEFTVAALGEQNPPAWPQFSELATGAGLAELRQDGTTLAVRHPVEVPLAEPDRDLEDILRRLLDHWLTARDAAAQVAALRWAVALRDWGAIDPRWLYELQHVSLDRDPEVVAMLDALPVEARKANPILTWAWGASGTYAANAGSSHTIAITRLVADAVALHSRWQEAPTVDAAVTAGCIWMLAQRFLPTSPPSAALEGAWATHLEVSRYIAEQRRHHSPPSPIIEVTFRAGSARIALARADLRHVTVEADYALALDPDIAAPLVRGGANFAMELMGFPSEPYDRPESEAGFGIGIAFQDSMSERLSRALSMVRQLDRAGCEAALHVFDGMPPGAPGWTGVVFLQMLNGALWGDPEATLTRADAAAARHGMVWQEHRGPLGQILLARGRVALLNRIGSHHAAHEVAHALPALLRRVAEAQTRLWAGDFSHARRITDAGLHDPETTLVDRVMLLAVRAATLALDPASSPESQAAAARLAVDACLEHDVWVALALVPPETREGILDVAAADDPPHPRLDLLRERIRELSGDPRRTSAQIPLSRRERVLLPLLASTQTVPEIATALHVSPNTVRKQVVTLRAKFDAGSRQELVRRAREAGLL